MKHMLTLLTLLGILPLWGQDDFVYEDPSTGDEGPHIAWASVAAPGMEGRTTDQAFDINTNQALIEGTRVQTPLRQFGELSFIDGSRIQLDGDTSMELQAIHSRVNDESVTILLLHEGSLFLHVTPLPEHLSERMYRVDTQHGSIYLASQGIYKIEAKAYQTRLNVYRGIGEIAGEADSSLVRSGEYATVFRQERPSQTRRFNAYYKDEFTTWAYDRAVTQPGVSAKYVDSALAYQSRVLDDHGRWEYSREYDTHVWVPYVASSWRPYYNGYWSDVYGSMIWVGHDPFSWVTMHYGRWGWDIGFGWHWIPGRYFAPAWVAWTVTDALFGWIPLGCWNRPFYYDRHHRPRTIVINHFHQPYIFADRGTINVRDNRYRFLPRSPRTPITTRAIVVNRKTKDHHTEVLTAIRSPRTVTKTNGSTSHPLARSPRTTTATRQVETKAVSRYRTDWGSGRVTPRQEGTAPLNQNQNARTVTSSRNHLTTSSTREKESANVAPSRTNTSSSRLSQEPAREKSPQTVERQPSTTRSTPKQSTTPSRSRTNSAAPSTNTTPTNTSRSRVSPPPSTPKRNNDSAYQSKSTPNRATPERVSPPSRPSVTPKPSSQSTSSKERVRSSSSSQTNTSSRSRTPQPQQPARQR
jgi:hypothetical protein